MLQTITSTQNEQVKLWRSLLTTKGRNEQGKFTAEGEHLAGEALKEKKAQALIIAEDRFERYSAYAHQAEKMKLPITLVSARVMDALCDAKTPQGIIAICSIPAATQVKGNRFAALDGVQDPGNVGTMDAAGFDGLLIDEKTADPYGPKALRASMGAVFRVPVYKGDLVQMLTAFNGGCELYAGALDGEPFFERTREKERVCVIIGNEGAGISDRIYAIDGIKKVKLPMVGGAESLNATVAGAIMIYDIVRCGR